MGNRPFSRTFGPVKMMWKKIRLKRTYELMFAKFKNQTILRVSLSLNFLLFFYIYFVFHQNQRHSKMLMMHKPHQPLSINRVGILPKKQNFIKVHLEQPRRSSPLNNSNVQKTFVLKNKRPQDLEKARGKIQIPARVKRMESASVSSVQKSKSFNNNAADNKIKSAGSNLPNILAILNDNVVNNKSLLQKRLNYSCDTFHPIPSVKVRGKFKIYQNFKVGTKRFKCDESVTYTTHSDFTYLDNLHPLIDRWRAPLSVALYAPGTDFEETVKRILYLRECIDLIKKFVTFHLYFDLNHPPTSTFLKKFKGFLKEKVNCKIKPFFRLSSVTYKKKANLTYPVNVGRNVARENAPTLYILASDIELYPNPGLAQDFIKMVRRTGGQGSGQTRPRVYTLPIFELDQLVRILPKNKTELQGLLAGRRAIPFHSFVCEPCHRFPWQDKWIAAKSDGILRTFHVGKRTYKFVNWEPLYIGTKNDPLYDERLSWDGQNDKMSQAYILCLLDYDFHILSTAFLIHRPGIKKLTTKTIRHYRNPIVSNQLEFIRSVILPEITAAYGKRTGCSLS